jgi:hypothetical protein
MRLSQISLAVTRLGGQDADAALRKALWPTGTEPGLWIDPSYTSASRQNSAGTTPLSTIGTVADSANPVGLIADQHFGTVAEVYGPENVYNGDFSFDGTWGKGAGVTISSGRANFAASNGFLGQNIFSVVAGDLYKLTFSLASVSGGSVVSSLDGNTSSAYVSDGTYTRYIVGTATVSTLLFIGTAFTGSIDNVSLVRVAKGTHLSQATSTARPLASARKNLWVSSDDFTHASYRYTNASVTREAMSNPLGTTNVNKVTGAGVVNAFFDQYITDYGLNKNCVQSQTIIFKNIDAATLSTAFAAGWTTVDLSTMAVSSTGGSSDGVLVDLGGGWYSFTATETKANEFHFFSNIIDVGLPSTKSMYFAGGQLELGGSYTGYQRVISDSNYAASAGIVMAKLDGVDDGWVSATVAAGAIGNSNMELLMAVRIDEWPVDDGIVSQIGGPNYAWATGGGGTPSSGVGTPTYYVNNVGVAATRAAIDAAIGIGKWAIVESGDSIFPGGPTLRYRGGPRISWRWVLVAKASCYSPQPQHADRNKARTALAASVGLVL